MKIGLTAISVIISVLVVLVILQLNLVIRVQYKTSDGLPVDIDKVNIGRKYCFSEAHPKLGEFAGRWTPTSAVNNASVQWGHLRADREVNQTILKFQPDECHLPKFDMRVFLELVSGRTLLFLGDSLSRHSYFYLYRRMLTELNEGKEFQSEDLFDRKKNDACWSFPSYNFRLCYRNADCELDERFEIAMADLKLTSSDIVEANTGAHNCRTGFDHKDQRYKNSTDNVIFNTRAFLAKVSSLNRKPYIVWRHTGATHFGTTSGEYCQGKDKSECFRPCKEKKYIPGTTGPKNDAIASMLEKANVPVLPIYNPTLQATPMHHPGKGDCTHWRNPSIAYMQHELLVSYLMYNVLPLDP